MFHFWAKTDTDSGTLRMHSVPHHCLDVAAAAVTAAINRNSMKEKTAP